MSCWIDCATPGCPGDMRYAAPGRGHIPGCTSPVTASDARPPSDTGTTGWHTHGGECVWPDGRCYVCDAEDLYDPPPNNPSARPVLVVDPAEARETIARVIADHYPTGYTCGETCDHNLNSPQGWAGHLATAVLAALAGQDDQP